MACVKFHRRINKYSSTYREAESEIRRDFDAEEGWEDEPK